MSDLESAWGRLSDDVRACRKIDNLISAKANSISIEHLNVKTKSIVDGANFAYLDFLSKASIDDLTDENLKKYSKYTEGMPLKNYENALDLVPTLVNLVSLADAIPLKGSKLPFDLKKIAVRCKGAVYFAPRRFTAVQLAFDSPRSRVLLFHTGRIVGTGCDSAIAAKLAVARAIKTIAIESAVHVGVRRFAVINQVGAVSLGSRLNCDAFADTHSSTAHYDPKSFVGLAWRPVSESVCSEIYSTGKANLPGSRRERQLLGSFSRMAPELLRHSANPSLASRFSEDLRRAHLPENHTRQAPRASVRVDTAVAEVDKEGVASCLWDDDDEDEDDHLCIGNEKASNKRSFSQMSELKDVKSAEQDESAFGDLFEGF